MICISLASTTHQEFERQSQLLADQGAEMIELRVDYLTEPPDLEKLIATNPVASLVTARRRQDGGQWNGTEQQRRELLRQAIRAGAQYVDIEEDIAASLPRTGETKRVISYHNFERTPSELDTLYKSMSALDPDVIKIVSMALAPADNVRMLEMVQLAEIPTVGFCMGELGTISRILCGKFGSPFTYAGYSPAVEVAPGQLGFDQVKNLYRFDEITERTAVFGVIGDPVGHSLSPLLHNSAFKEIGFDGVYLPLKIPAGQLQESLAAYQQLNIRGYSVTIPHKLAALEFSDLQDSQSQSIGASNTLTLVEGQWHATNTDYDAIIETIQTGLVNGSRSPDLGGQHVLIMGAGGVARAAVSAMLNQHASVTISNRSGGKAEELAAEFGCESIPWEDRGAIAADVLVNCTSVGMHPNVNASPFEREWLTSSTFVFDTVYTPEQTMLIRDAKSVGCLTMGGLEMFVRQAARQFRLFTGQAPPLDFMRETLARLSINNSPGLRSARGSPTGCWFVVKLTA